MGGPVDKCARSKDPSVHTVALGRKGRAFDSLDALIICSRELALLEGASLAVAYCVLAWAKATNTPVINAIPLLLSETDRRAGHLTGPPQRSAMAWSC